MSTITAESVVDAEAARPLRADARRNRERVLVAATAVFAEEGADASVAEIARRAGVGAGTLFRHFPTKHDLLLATLEQGFDDIQAAMERAEAMDDAWEGLVHVLTVCAEIQARDRSFLDSVGPELFREPSLQRRNQERMEHIRQLVARAQAAGLLRDDLRAEDVPAERGRRRDRPVHQRRRDLARAVAPLSRDRARRAAPGGGDAAAGGGPDVRAADGEVRRGPARRRGLRHRPRP
jgi:AcrR family transcriptional regulator